MIETPPADCAEEWRAVPGWEGLYEVSSRGAVRSLQARRGDGMMVGCINRYGYRTVNLTRNRKSHNNLVHRLVCMAFHGPPPEGREVGHLDSDKSNNSAANLAWVTRLENMIHRFGEGPRHAPKGIRQRRGPRVLKGQPRGERHGSSKLTESQVLSLRKEGASGITHRALAAKYGISKGQVTAILHRKKWSHI